MTEHTAVVRQPRGKGLRSRKAKQRKAQWRQFQPAPIEVPPDQGPQRPTSTRRQPHRLTQRLP